MHHVTLRARRCLINVSPESEDYNGDSIRLRSLKGENSSLFFYL